MKLSFKQFLEESKQQLLKAANAAPVHGKRYHALKYSSFQIGETVLHIRPRYQLIVEWQYQDLTNPHPISVQMITPKQSAKIALSEDEQVKLVRWLKRNMREEAPILKGI